MIHYAWATQDKDDRCSLLHGQHMQLPEWPARWPCRAKTKIAWWIKYVGSFGHLFSDQTLFRETRETISKLLDNWALMKPPQYTPQHWKGYIFPGTRPLFVLCALYTNQWETPLLCQGLTRGTRPKRGKGYDEGERRSWLIYSVRSFLTRIVREMSSYPVTYVSMQINQYSLERQWRREKNLVLKGYLARLLYTKHFHWPLISRCNKRGSCLLIFEDERTFFSTTST